MFLLGATAVSKDIPPSLGCGKHRTSPSPGWAVLPEGVGSAEEKELVLLDQNLLGTGPQCPARAQQGLSESGSFGLEAAGQGLTAWMDCSKRDATSAGGAENKELCTAQKGEDEESKVPLLSSPPPCAVTDLRAEVSSSPQKSHFRGCFCDSQPWLQ